MILEVLLTLNGMISNEPGLIGIRVSSDGYIAKVHSHSPAHDAGIRKGDKIIDYMEEDRYAGEVWEFEVKRGKEVIRFKVQEVPSWEVYD